MGRGPACTIGRVSAGEASVHIKPIRTEEDHDRVLARIDALWGAPSGTPEGDEREVLVTLSIAYEEAQHPILPPDPIEAIDARLDQLGLTRDALAPLLGDAEAVEAVMSGRRPLTVPMIQRLRDTLDIPADILISRAPVAQHVPPHKEGMSMSS